MSLYIVQKNRKDLKADIREAKRVCKKLHISFSGDVIIDTLYFPKRTLGLVGGRYYEFRTS